MRRIVRQLSTMRCPGHAARSCRRGDRIGLLFAAVHESGYGPNAKCPDVRHSAAVGGKADSGWTSRAVAIDPTRTWNGSAAPAFGCLSCGTRRRDDIHAASADAFELRQAIKLQRWPLHRFGDSPPAQFFSRVSLAWLLASSGRRVGPKISAPVRLDRPTAAAGRSPSAA